MERDGLLVPQDDLAEVDALDAPGNHNTVQRTARTKVSDLGSGNTISTKK